MKKVWMLCLLATVCFTGKPVESQDALPQFSIKVVVDIEDVLFAEDVVYVKKLVDTDDNKSFQENMKKYIQGGVEYHLRELADVEVVETSPSFVLRIILVGPIRTDRAAFGDVPTPDDGYYMTEAYKRGIHVQYMKKELIVAFYVLTKSNADAHDLIESGVISADRIPNMMPWGLARSVDRALEKFR